MFNEKPANKCTSLMSCYGFQVTDKREVAFQDKRTELLFPGTGISLGSQKFKDQHTNTEATEVTSDLPNAGTERADY